MRRARQVVILAAVIASSCAIATALMTALFMVDLAADHGSLWPWDWAAFWGFGVITFIVAVAIALAIGVPGFFVLQRFGLLKPWTAGFTGALLGVAMSLPHLTLGFPWWFCAGLGLVASLLAWRLSTSCHTLNEPSIPE